jgi:cation transport regulator
VPYTSNAELPPRVRSNLPQHAQAIYREAFNSAYAEYGHNDARASRVAWAAVSRSYKKRDGKWIER